MRSIFTSIHYNYIMMLSSTGNWREPISSWPAGYPYTNHFRNSPLIWSAVYDKDGWAGYSAGNRLFDLDQGTDSRMMFPAWGADVAGAGDPARDYKRDAVYTDGTRTHLVYEAGWPTTAGLDYKIRMHQYSSNEQNLNDFVALEISITNTGNVDSDGDGTIDETGNKVDGIVFQIAGDVSPSVLIGTNGDRGGNKLAAGRTFGYVAAPDETGAPYDFFTWFANVPPSKTTNRATPPPGERQFGIDNTNNLLGYTDVWNAWAWIGTKQGSIVDGNMGAITASSPDKSTVFGSHSVGEGNRRGWYNSSPWQAALQNRRNSELTFRNGMATWFEDYGKLSNGGDVLVNLNPNSNYFSGGEADKIETWVVGDATARPNGDLKYGHEDVGTGIVVEQPIWEPEWNAGAASGDFYDGVEGWSKEYTFGQAPQHMHGPFSLEVGESMTTIFIQATGFRMEGVAEAIEAVRWAWERGWDISTDMPTPAAPEMKPISTPQASALIAWTDVSDLGPVDGYKIWKASQFKQNKYLDAGLRAMDKYQHQHNPDEGRDAFLDPVNPNFDVGDPDVFFAGDIQGVYQPAEWGTYDLLANISVGELSQYTSGVPSGYDYAFEDLDVITGFTYWYYISAYRNGSFTGPQGPVPVGHIESANFNRNGRNDPSSPDGEIGLGSLWAGTYPYAFRNADFPDPGTQELKNIGAPFTVTPPVADVNDVADLITVSPNPYKITGLNDIRSDASSHNIDFLNLPEAYTLTIVDVSGQIIFQVTEGAGTNGKYTWDLFSKDGPEIASGLYIYHLQYGGGACTTGEPPVCTFGQKLTGHFAILR